MKKVLPDYFRNAIFGVEDSLVSTVGVLFGVASSVTNRRIILLTAFVVISVEALSMGVGSYLSEKSTHAMLKSSSRKSSHHDKPVIGGLIMLFSYFLAGFVPTLPYLFFKTTLAKFISVVISVAALFSLGFLPKKKLRDALEMALLGGGAILVGFLVGQAVKLLN